MDHQEDFSSNRRGAFCRYQNDYKSSDTTIVGGLAPNNHSHSRTPTIKVGVYMMSGAIVTLEVEKTITAQQLISLIQTEAELGVARAPPACPTQPLAITGQAVFALWLSSSGLEVQLNPTQKPVELANRWDTLIRKYGFRHRSGYEDDTDEVEEPVLYFRRNVFLSRRDEEQIKDSKVLELLYAEARHNVLEGRYPCEGQARYASLGALQARIELGPYNAQTHTLAYFRKHRGKFLPCHYTSPSILLGLGFGLGLVGGKGAPEARLLEQYKRIPNHNSTTNPRKLVRKYLEFCWGLPCYGAAFFQGQIERPIRGLTSCITNRDLQVLIAINSVGVFIVDDVKCSLLLGLKYSELNWEMAKPSDESNPDCLPCLFLQFPVRENGARVYKILQIFSRQTIMMDTLISGFVEDNRRNVDGSDLNTGLSDTSNSSSIGSFTNKLSKFTLATFDEEGHCIGQMGTWSFQ